MSKIRNSIGTSVIILSDGFSQAGGSTTERKLTIISGDISMAGDGLGYVHTMPPRTDNIIGRIENHSMTLVTIGGYI